MATTASTTRVQELYIAYFGRPADAAGLAFYADALDAGTTTISAIASSFGTSAEAAPIVALSTSAYVSAVYLQAFGRAYNSATDGVFWTDAITAGATTKESAMVQILGGAGGTDITAVANKVAVANTYTTAVTTDSKSYAGATAAAAAKAVLDNVTATASTVTSGNAAAQTAVTALAAGTVDTFPLTITSHTDPGYELLTRKIDVFGIGIYAADGVAENKLIHAAHVLAEYLDNDEDGVVDNQLVVDAIIASKASIGLWKNEDDLDVITEGQREFTMDLGDTETRPEWHVNNEPTAFDASLEEILHSITQNGYALVYPEIFGERTGTSVADAMDVARGGQFIEIPEQYPESAWYTYDDPSCDYQCMVTEYMYWGLSSILGAQASRLDVIGQEWKLNTAELVETNDPTLYNLLTDDQYNFPTYLPDGTYTPDLL